MRYVYGLAIFLLLLPFSLFADSPSRSAAATSSLPPSAQRTVAFAGANAKAQLSPESATGGVANYYTGNDRKRWIEGLPLYGGVRYHGIYAGTDLVFHGRKGRLEYNFELAPGAAPSSIVLEFAGVERITINPSGDLVLVRGDQDVRMLAPEAYQQEGKSKVRAEYRLLAGIRVGFTVGAYDRSKPLVIDPVVAYTTISE